MKKKRKGMTLVELIAAMAIFVLISMAITSTLVFSIKSNSNNKSKFQSNANSRTFVESINVASNKPEKFDPLNNKGIKEGYYYLAFKEQSEINDLVKNFSTTAISANLSEAPPTYDTLKAIASTDDKYLLAVKIDWDDTDKIYIFDIWSWDLSKGNISEITRRTLIAAK